MERYDTRISYCTARLKFWIVECSCPAILRAAGLSRYSFLLPLLANGLEEKLWGLFGFFDFTS